MAVDLSARTHTHTPLHAVGVVFVHVCIEGIFVQKEKIFGNRTSGSKDEIKHYETLLRTLMTLTTKTN